MASLPPKQFNIALQKVSTQVPGLALQYQKEVTLFALNRIVLKTPVDTGLARGNWLVRSRTTEEKSTNLDQSGGATIAAAVSHLPSIKKAFGTIWIFNNLDYIQFLEEGSSMQAPAGMIASSIPGIQAFADTLGRNRKFRFRGPR